MELSDICIQRNSSKLKLVLFFYFHVTSYKKGDEWSFWRHIQRTRSKLKVVLFSYFNATSCKKSGAWCFWTYIYIQRNSSKLKVFSFVTSLLLVVRKELHGVFGHIYTKK